MTVKKPNLEKKYFTVIQLGSFSSNLVIFSQNSLSWAHQKLKIFENSGLEFFEKF